MSKTMEYLINNVSSLDKAKGKSFLYRVSDFTPEECLIELQRMLNLPDWLDIREVIDFLESETQ